MAVSAIIFDMGDIFFDATIWRRAMTDYLRQQDVEITYKDFCGRWDAKLVEVHVGRMEYWQAFDKFLASLGLQRVARESAVTFAKQKAKEVEDRVLFPGVSETLHELNSRGVKLAVLSDTESSEQRVRERLDALGIESVFAAVVTSADIGHRKPDREAYAEAVHRLQVPVSNSYFVGHDDDELIGAKAFGLRTVAYNSAPTVPADHHIPHFAALLDLQ